MMLPAGTLQHIPLERRCASASVSRLPADQTPAAISTTFKLASPTPTPVSPPCTSQVRSHDLTSSGQVGIRVDDQAVGIRAVPHSNGGLQSFLVDLFVPKIKLRERERVCVGSLYFFH
jgi:hypothetical protein